MHALEIAIRLDTQNPRAWHIKGYLFEELGRTDDAQMYYDKAKELGYAG